jgi:hypothetical protein
MHFDEPFGINGFSGWAMFKRKLLQRRLFIEVDVKPRFFWHVNIAFPRFDRIRKYVVARALCLGIRCVDTIFH